MLSEIFTIPSYHVYRRKTRRKCAKISQRMRKKRAIILPPELSTTSQKYEVKAPLSSARLRKHHLYERADPLLCEILAAALTVARCLCHLIPPLPIDELSAEDRAVSVAHQLERVVNPPQERLDADVVLTQDRQTAFELHASDYGTFDLR